MALETYTEVLLLCNCLEGTVSTAKLYNGTHTDHSNLVDRINYADILDHDNADRNELIADIEAGNADVYVQDDSASATTWLIADVPSELQRILSAFPFHPQKGWEFPYHVAQQADITEDDVTGAMVLESPLGNKPGRISAGRRHLRLPE